MISLLSRESHSPSRVQVNPESPGSKSVHLVTQSLCSAAVRCACLPLVIFALAAQTAAPQFEAASVKPVAFIGLPRFAGLRSGPGTDSPGRIVYSTVPLRRVLATAFDIDSSRIIGPAWLDEDRFDITATLRSNATAAQLRTMLQKLLADRFQLAWHGESRKLPAYILSVASDGSRMTAASGSGSSGCVVSRPAPPAGVAPRAVTRADAINHHICSNISMSEFAKALQDLAPRYVDLPVVDRTGLTGRYDFKLDWTTLQSRPSDDEPNASRTGVIGGFTMYEALERQAGLKIEPHDAPLDAIVIDRINRTPSAN